MIWDEIIKTTFGHSIELIGDKITMVGQYRAQGGMDEMELCHDASNPTYSQKAERHAELCQKVLDNIQRYILEADKLLVKGQLNPVAHEDVNSTHVMLQMGFKGVLLDSMACMSGIISLIGELPGKREGQRLSSLADACAFLKGIYPENSEINYLDGEIVNAVERITQVCSEQSGKITFFFRNGFAFQVETSEEKVVCLSQSRICSATGVIQVVPFLFLVLIHLAKCLDAAIMCYLRRRTDDKSIRDALKWFVGDRTLMPFYPTTEPRYQENLARVYEKYFNS